MSAEDLIDKGSTLLKEHGIPTVLALVLLGVLFGWIPSALLEVIQSNNALLVENRGLLQSHKSEQSISSSKLINLALTDCVNKAVSVKDYTAARACTQSVDDNEYIQLRRLTNLIDKKETALK